MTEHTTVGAIIREIRQDNYMTQSDLSDLSGWSVATILRIEKGEADPKFSTLVSIFGAMGYTLNIRLVSDNKVMLEAEV